MINLTHPSYQQAMMMVTEAFRAFRAAEVELDAAVNRLASVASEGVPESVILELLMARRTASGGAASIRDYVIGG